TETQLFSGTSITVPTQLYRQGNFSQALTARPLGTDPLGRQILENTVYDPATDRLAPNGQRVRDPYPGNIIPAALMDPVALNVQKLIPLPDNNTKLIQNLTPTYPGQRIS